jgi:hypothetical protein
VIVYCACKYDQALPLKYSTPPIVVLNLAIPVTGAVGRCVVVPIGSTTAPVFKLMSTVLLLAVNVKFAELVEDIRFP